MDLIDFTDEQLVSQYQCNNDQDAFAELYSRYSRSITLKSSQAHFRNKSIEEHRFHTRYVDKFMAAVKAFEPTKTVPFGKFLNVKLYRADMDVIREQSYTYRRTEDGRLIPKPKDTTQPLSTEFFEDGESLISDASAYDEYPLEYHEIIGHLAEDERTALKMKMYGYTSIEIAYALGRQGTEETLRKYVKRLFDRIRDKIQAYYASAGISFA